MVGYGKRIEQLRKNKGLSRKQLAQRLNCAESTVANYESEERMPSLEKVVKIAAEFHVSVDYLIGRPQSKERIDISGYKDHEKLLIWFVIGWLDLLRHIKDT